MGKAWIAAALLLVLLSGCGEQPLTEVPERKVLTAFQPLPKKELSISAPMNGTAQAIYCSCRWHRTNRWWGIGVSLKKSTIAPSLGSEAESWWKGRETTTWTWEASRRKCGGQWSLRRDSEACT